MVATEVSLLLHVPSVNAFVSIVIFPTQMADSPIIADGTAFTVIVTVADVSTPRTVADTVYVVVTVGEAIVVAQVVHESPVDGAQE
jgi:hypothetical protein